MDLFFRRLSGLILIVGGILVVGTLIALAFSSPDGVQKGVAANPAAMPIATPAPAPELQAMDIDDEIALIRDAMIFRSGRRVAGNDLQADTLMADFRQKLDGYAARRARDWKAFLRDIVVRSDGKLTIDAELLGQDFHVLNFSFPISPGTEAYDAIKESRVGALVVISGYLDAPGDMKAEPMSSTVTDFLFTDIKTVASGPGCEASAYVYCGP